MYWISESAMGIWIKRWKFLMRPVDQLHQKI